MVRPAAYQRSGESSFMPTDPTWERPVLSVVIISYNTRAMTLDCLRDLFADLGALPAEVWVVDNASKDGSPAAIREAFPQVRLIANDRNAGFGAANNQAIGGSQGRFLMLLNSDAFVHSGAVRALLRYLERHPEVGAVGPRLLNPDGTLQRSCYPFPSPVRAWIENLWLSAAFPNHPVVGDYSRWSHDADRLVEWVIGACVVVRREVLDQVGGFDERFFMYAEETDWQRRIRAAGWQIGFTPDAVVTHVGGASGVADLPRIKAGFFESLDRYEHKHHGWPGLVALRGAMAVGSVLRAVLWSACWLLRPSWRPLAGAKLKLHLWLVARQVTRWRALVAPVPTPVTNATANPA